MGQLHSLSVRVFIATIKDLQWLWRHGNCEHWITFKADILQCVWWRLWQLHLCCHQQTWKLEHKLSSVWWVQESVTFLVLQKRKQNLEAVTVYWLSERNSLQLFKQVTPFWFSLLAWIKLFTLPESFYTSNMTTKISLFPTAEETATPEWGCTATVSAARKTDDPPGTIHRQHWQMDAYDVE